MALTTNSRLSKARNQRAFVSQPESQLWCVILVQAISRQSAHRKRSATTLKTLSTIRRISSRFTCARAQVRPSGVIWTPPLADHSERPSRLVQGAVIGCLFLSDATVATAHPVHKVVDEQGNVTFTDTSPSDAAAELRTLTATNTTPSMPFGDDAIADDTAMQDTEAPVTYSTRITFPLDQSTIPMGADDTRQDASPEQVVFVMGPVVRN